MPTQQLANPKLTIIKDNQRKRNGARKRERERKNNWRSVSDVFQLYHYQSGVFEVCYFVLEHHKVGENLFDKFSRSSSFTARVASLDNAKWILCALT